MDRPEPHPDYPAKPPLVRLYEHVSPKSRARALLVRGNIDCIKITCDAPGVAGVSHTMGWQEWDELVKAVAARTE